MMRWIERAFPYLLILPATLPLIYWGGLLYPYLTPKTLLFRADAILAVAAFVALALSGKSFYTSRLRNWETWIPAALLTVAYATSVIGIDFYHSFWSVFDRGDGLLTLTSLVVFFYLTLLYADRSFIDRVLRIIGLVATGVAVFTILQWIQLTSGMDIPLIPTTLGRLGGTMGNAAYLASYLSMTIFSTIMLVPTLRGNIRKIFVWGALAQVLAVLISATRGSLLALALAAFLSVCYLAWVNGKYRAYARMTLVGMVVLAGLFFVFRAQLATVPIRPIARIASISLADATVESRLYIWRAALEDSISRPFGVGAEHIETVFNKFYDPTALVEQWFDRTHNAFLDYFVQYGYLGLALFLALIGVFLREAWALARSKIADEAQRGRLFLLLGIVYAVQDFFVFDSVVTLWLFLTFFVVLLVYRGGVAQTIMRRRLPVSFSVGIAGVVALLVIPVSLQPLRANLLLADGYTYQLTDVRRTIASVEKGYSLGTYSDIEYGYQLYEMYTDRQINKVSGENKIRAYRLAREILAKNFAKYPYDTRTATYYAHILDLAPKGEEPEEDLLISVISTAIELSPKRIQPRYLFANIAIRKGDAEPMGSPKKKQYYDVAIRGLTQYSDLVPTFAEPRYIIATLYLTLGERVVAEQWADEGRAVYTKLDVNTARRAARYYVTVEDWENARFFLAEVLSENSTDYPYMYDLAKAEFLAGNVERAREIVDEIRAKAPGVVETDPAFLEALGE